MLYFHRYNTIISILSIDDITYSYFPKKSLHKPKGIIRRTDNTMTKQKMTKRQTMFDKNYTENYIGRTEQAKPIEKSQGEFSQLV